VCGWTEADLKLAKFVLCARCCGAVSREAIMNKGLLVTIFVALTVTEAAAQAPTKDAHRPARNHSSSIRPMCRRQATP